MGSAKISEILSQFKEVCRTRGWKTSDNEDWVEKDGSFHNFLWTREVSLSSFQRITAGMKCIVHEGLSYRIVKASFSAWLFCQPPSEAIVKTTIRNPGLSCTTAIYDLSPLLGGKEQCFVLNQTGSLVLQEFESFLQSVLALKLDSLQLDTTKTENGTIAIQQLT